MLILLPDKCLLILLKTVISQVYCKREVECTKLVVMVVSEWGRHLQQDGIVYVLHLETSRVDLVHVKFLGVVRKLFRDRMSTRLNSSHVSNSYAVFCLKKKKITGEYISIRLSDDIIKDV